MFLQLRHHALLPHFRQQLEHFASRTLALGVERVDAASRLAVRPGRDVICEGRNPVRVGAAWIARARGEEELSLAALPGGDIHYGPDDAEDLFQHPDGCAFAAAHQVRLHGTGEIVDE